MTVSRITGPAGTNQSSRPAKTRQGDGPRFDSLLGGEEASTGVAGTTAMQSISGVLALQQVDGTDEDGRRKAQQRAEDLLDGLDRLRLAILDGAVPMAQLQQLVGTIRSQRPDVADPNLAAILDEIDLRAQVELAKLERAASREGA